MSDSIARVGYAAPGYARLAISEGRGQFAGCLGQRFESVKRGILD